MMQAMDEPASMKVMRTDDLPKAMKETMPDSALKLFLDIYNHEKMAGLSDAVSFEIAWIIIKKRFTLIEGFWVAMSKSFEQPKLYSFNMEVEGDIVMNSENEELVLDAVLADTTMNSKGQYFNEEDLQTISEQINTLGSTLPDVDHEKLMELIKIHGGDVDVIREELKNTKGIFKSIQATLKKGKLWIQAVLDKRYKNHAESFKGLSIEAFGDKQDDGRIKNPEYLGFTFTNNPELKEAKIAI